MQWSDVLADPSLQGLPYKIELNARGVIEMSPAGTHHALTQGRVLRKLALLVHTGELLGECAIQTPDGVRVPDAAWATDDFIAQQSQHSPLQRAPQLCVEVISPSNSRLEIAAKIDAYFAAGAVEVWTISESGDTEFHAPNGKLKDSALVPGFHL